MEYDPAVPTKDKSPVPVDVVCCFNVLENVEPEYLENVLDDLSDLADKLLVASVSTVASLKFMPNGDNAHLTKEEIEFWLPKFWKRFHIHSFARMTGGFWIICKKRIADGDNNSRSASNGSQ